VQRVFRVCRAVYARLDGEGARRVGGRWNSPGRAVVYMAGSISLAVLENLVHLTREDFPVGYVVIGAVLPTHLPILAPEDLAGAGQLASSQMLGDHWLEEQTSAVLRVPSVIVPQEYNYLLNPKHPDFAQIVVELPMPFIFDERLFR
jgi:RES domain-containing protein